MSIVSILILIMIRVRLNTGAIYEALAIQGSSVLIKDARKNRALFVNKSNIVEWHNGNSKYLPKMDGYTFEPTPFDRIATDGIRVYLESMGVKQNVAIRIANCCVNSGISSLGELYRLGKTGALKLRDMGEGSISELERVYQERVSEEWK